MKKIICILCCLGFLNTTFNEVLATTFPEVQSQYVFIMNMDTNQVLYEKNSEEKMYPASLTKMMTTLVALDHIEHVEETYTLPAKVFTGLVEANASVAGFKVNEEVKIIDLLYGVMLPSGADASIAIAMYVAKNEEHFVELMNEKAKSLGMKNTHFTNVSGLHDEQHYSTAKDMAILLKAALKHETFVQMFEADTYQTSTSNAHPNGMTFQSTRVQYLHVLNEDKGYMLGSKTGYTLEGGLCLASTAIINGATYIMINANAGIETWNATHVKDAIILEEYLANTYTRKTVYAKNEKLKKVSVSFGEKEQVSVYANQDIFVLMNTNDEQYRLKWIWDDVQAPLKKGEQVGKLQVYYQNEKIHTYPLFAMQTVEKNWLSYGWYIIIHYVIWLLLAFLLFSKGWIKYQKIIRKKAE